MTSTRIPSLLVRDAQESDLVAIREIYNQGIEDRVATLDEKPKSDSEIQRWFAEHVDRFVVLTAQRGEDVVGWASLNAYSHRCADRNVADLSVYVERSARGAGVGSALLQAIEARAYRSGFRKIVLFALARNDAGQRLYRRLGFRDVGIFKEQGRLDGDFVDIIAMEKILKPLVLFVCKHNTGRSQMAEAFFRRFAGDAIEVASAGTIAADRPDPLVVAAMGEVDIDISAARPKLLESALVVRADRIITMGCDVEGVPRVDDDWALPDPKGQSIECVREIRDAVCTKAGRLANELLRMPAAPGRL